MLLADAETFVPVVGILVLFGLPITYAIISRVLAHQERIEMLRRGIVPPPDPKWAKRAARWGCADPGMAAPPQGQPYAMGFEPYGVMRADNYLRKGITLAMIGLALLIGLSFIGGGYPGPWLLGGLIPLFAGIAQIIIALLSGARLSFGGFQGPVGGPPPGPGVQYDATRPGPPPAGNGPRDVGSGPYAWRPGPTTELQPGPRPPDVKP